MSEKLVGLKIFERDETLNKRIEFCWPEWERSYPHVDLKAQLQFAHSWLVSNGKFKKDYARFLNNWFKSTEERNVAMFQKDKPDEPIPTPKNDFQHYRESDAQHQEDMTMEEMQEIRKKNFGEIRKSPISKNEARDEIHGIQCVCEECFKKAVMGVRI